MTELNLNPGPWLTAFKQTLYTDYDEDLEISVPGTQRTDRFPIKDLAEKIALITPGQTITYITDVILNESNAGKIVDFARDSDYLFLESHFLDKDSETAREKYHLTARQAGKIAGLANARRLVTFHYSPRYTDRGGEIEREARLAYEEFKGIEG